MTELDLPYAAIDGGSVAVGPGAMLAVRHQLQAGRTIDGESFAGR